MNNDLTHKVQSPENTPSLASPCASPKTYGLNLSCIDKAFSLYYMAHFPSDVDHVY